MILVDFAAVQHGKRFRYVANRSQTGCSHVSPRSKNPQLWTWSRIITDAMHAAGGVVYYSSYFRTKDSFDFSSLLEGYVRWKKKKSLNLKSAKFLWSLGHCLCSRICSQLEVVPSARSHELLPPKCTKLLFLASE